MVEKNCREYKKFDNYSYLAAQSILLCGPALAFVPPTAALTGNPEPLIFMAVKKETNLFWLLNFIFRN